MTEVQDYWKVGQKAKLIDMREAGNKFSALKTKEGNLWIDLNMPDPYDRTKTIEDTIYFWGMPELYKRTGFFVPYGDIFEIIESIR